jgi:transposase InsO family protein/transposase-like protein
MRYNQAEKQEIIRLVEESAISVRKTLQELDVPRSTFYAWYRKYREDGYDGLCDQPPRSRRFWNRIPDEVKEKVVDIALEYPDKSPRQLAWHITDTQHYFISESSVYRILKSYDLITSPAFIVMSARDKFQHPTKRVNELWQTDFTYFKVTGWGWYFLSTVLDDYSRYIITWKLFTTMSADDVKETLNQALEQSGVRQVKVKHRPRLLSDNGPCYISKELGSYLDELQIQHTRGAPYHPMTQGKIERYHRSLKNVVNLDYYYFPWDLEREIAKFVEYYNHERYHESLDNLTPADVYYGRGRKILDQREVIKRSTLQARKKYNLKQQNEAASLTQATHKTLP